MLISAVLMSMLSKFLLLPFMESDLDFEANWCLLTICPCFNEFAFFSMFTSNRKLQLQVEHMGVNAQNTLRQTEQT